MKNGQFRLLTNNISPKYGKILFGKQTKRKTDQGTLLSDNLIIKYENNRSEERRGGANNIVSKTKWFKDGTRVVL